MPRRRVAARKKLEGHDPYGDVLIGRFVSVIMKQGKKSLAERTFFQALDRISQKTGADSLEIFRKAVDNVKPSLEVKSRRVGGSTYQIPIEVNYDRRLALSIRWIIESARARGERGFANKLAGELIDASSHGGAAFKKKEDTHRMAEANKAFSHYKW